MISRIFRGENENAAVKRRRQIDTLKIFNDNVVELREDVEYQVEFDAGNKRMAIMVSLSPEFPLEKPVLRVSPPVTHPWCNEHSEITGAPGLLNFTVHSDLGRVVQAIIREFSKNPPQTHQDMSLASNVTHREIQGRISPPYSLQHYPELQSVSSSSYNTCYNPQYSQYSSSNTNLYKYNYPNSCVSDGNPQTIASTSYHSTFASNSGNSIHNHNVSPVQYSPDRRTISYVNSQYGNSNYTHSMSTTPSTTASAATAAHSIGVSVDFPELNNLSNDELTRLVEDEDTLDAFLDQDPQIKKINSSIDETIDCVEKIATDNLAKETELNALQDEVASKMTTVSVLKTRYDNLIQQYTKLSETFAPDNIKECLKRAADESHEQSENIAHNFLERKIDVERFLSTYIECRKLGQARRTKEEKLAHQLNELKRAGY